MTSRSTTASDVVLLVTIELNLVIQADDRAVHTGADETRLADLLEDSLVGPLAATHDRRQEQDAGAVRKGLHAIHDLLGGLLDHLPPADGAVRDAHPRVEQAEVVVDLGHGAHGRARVVAGGLLVDRDGR
jgi:hypothetical protein